MSNDVQINLKVQQLEVANETVEPPGIANENQTNFDVSAIVN